MNGTAVASTPGLGEQQGLGELAAGADAGGGERDRPFRADQVLDRREAGLRVGDEHEVVLRDAGDHLVVVDVDGLAGRHRERRDVGQRAHEHHERVPVGFGGGEFLGGDRPVGAGPVLHGDRLPEVLARRVGEGAADEVGAAAGVLADEQGDGAFRVGGATRGRGVGAEVAAAAGEDEKTGQPERGERYFHRESPGVRGVTGAASVWLAFHACPSPLVH
ncbi:hypothetical protein FHR83_001628 [Actinoplanes campanulatus]|uniref:Uncharacterized protein n=1 Tax=Actinoplanes campanulatus TaxID=113559 RepID=A0A7W5ADI9_9ACTN|nr:hypothetical protein [Actinoplanes campanulatus]MBB3093979.1 hypothetical protein [Actinoplanes campanulatus]GGN33459.1 hypothetical protein GCM10010109_55500 [Actinoplanes campanulatus]GID38325.1 hypothetical protein Aca09nite_48310 [Actinoplanes campanulatus]